MPRPEGDNLLEQLVHNLIRKVDDHYFALDHKQTASHDKLDCKISNLEDKLCDEIRQFKEDIADHIKTINTKLDSHETRLFKIEANWTTLMTISAIGAAAFTTLIQWLGSFLGKK